MWTNHFPPGLTAGHVELSTSSVYRGCCVAGRRAVSSRIRLNEQLVRRHVPRPFHRPSRRLRRGTVGPGWAVLPFKFQTLNTLRGEPETGGATTIEFPS